MCVCNLHVFICCVSSYISVSPFLLSAHPNSHFIETNHTYSMQLGNDRVWDYIGGIHMSTQPVCMGTYVHIVNLSVLYGVVFYPSVQVRLLHFNQIHNNNYIHTYVCLSLLSHPTCTMHQTFTPHSHTCMHVHTYNHTRTSCTHYR